MALKSFLIALTIALFFQLDLKKKTSLLILLLVLPTLVFQNEWVLSIIQVIISLLFLVYEYHCFKLEYIAIPLGIVGGSYFIEGILNGFTSLFVNDLSYRFTTVFSSLLLFISCVLFLRLTNYKQLKKYDIYIPFVLILYFMALTLATAYIGKAFSLKILYFLIIEFILLVLCSLQIFFVMNKQSQANADMTRRLAKEEVQKNMYNITQRSMNQISADKHMMTYTLMKINQMMGSKQDIEAKAFVEKELSKYTNYKTITSTGNPLFDYEMSNKINQITARNIEVKSLFSINEGNSILAEENTVYYIEKCLDDILSLNNNIEEIQLLFEEIQRYLKVRIVISYHTFHKKDRDYKFEKYDLLMNYKVNKDETYDEIIFLFNTK